MLFSAIAGPPNLGVLEACAEDAPLIAVAGVQPSPVLAKRLSQQANAAIAAVPSHIPDAGPPAVTGTFTGSAGRQYRLDFTRSDSGGRQLQGDWKAALVRDRIRSRLVLHVDKLPNGGFSWNLRNLTRAALSTRARQKAISYQFSCRG